MAKKKTLKKPESGEPAVLAAIAAMKPPFRAMGERLHALIAATQQRIEQVH